MVDFKGANLRKANLKWTNLREANLKWADLTKASLIEANLQRADIIKANLAGANLHRVDLTEANLREAHYLTFDQLSKVKTFHDAKLDKKLLNSFKKEGSRFLKVNHLTILDP